MVSAAFMDIFGILGFIVILYLGIRLRAKKTVEPWISTLLIAIGLIGLFVDSYIVFKNFIL